MASNGRVLRGLPSLFLATLWLMPACHPSRSIDTGSSRERVIVGDDDRTEPFSIGDAELADLSRKTAVAILLPETLREHADGVELDAPALAEAWGLCPDVRFAEQPSAAVCSGLLVAPDLVLTAGHCAAFVPCDTMRLVTRYYYESEERLAELTSDDVFGCSEIVARERSAPDASDRLDFAWIRLDRKVPSFDVAPVLVREPGDPLEVGEPLTMFGFPGGLPLKVDPGASVTDVRDEHLDYFVASTDSFYGNSGSPIFDASRRLVGIQSRGGADYVTTESGCGAAAVLEADPSLVEEEATYAFRAVDGLCAVSRDAPYCGDGLEDNYLQIAGGGCSAAGSPVPLGRGLAIAALGPLLLVLRTRSRCVAPRRRRGAPRH